MNRRKAHQLMIRSFPGGNDAMAAALGLTPSALDNRVYERKGQQMSTDHSLQMQANSGTTYFAEAIAAESGGVFIQLPDVGDIDREDLLNELNALHAEIGRLSQEFNASTSDNEIDKGERGRLEDIEQRIHQKLARFMALSFKVYCRGGVDG